MKIYISPDSAKDFETHYYTGGNIMKKYLVMSILKGEEWLELATTNEEEAIARAVDEEYYNQRDNKGKYTIEIRVIDADEDEEEYSDYDLLDFKEV